MNLRRTILLLAVACLAHPVSAEEKLQLLTPQEQFLFAGNPAEVTAVVRNTGASDLKDALETRLFLASAASMAPVHERQPLPEASFPARQAVVLTLSVPLPSVRVISRGVVKLYRAGEEFGSLPVRLVPEKPWSGFEALAGKPAGCWPNQAALHSALEHRGLALQALDDDSVRTFDGCLILVALRDSSQEAAWQETAKSVPAGCAVLILAAPATRAAELLLPVQWAETGGHRMALVQDWFVPDLDQSSLSHVRLMRVVEALLRPETLRIPGIKHLSKTTDSP